MAMAHRGIYNEGNKAQLCPALRGHRQMVVTLSIFKLVDFSVSKAYELKSLSSLARAGADGRDFLNIEVRGFVCEQGVRAEVAV